MAERIKMTWPQYLSGRCVFHGFIIRLTPLECEMLSVLLINRGRVVGRWDMAEAVYDEEAIERMADPVKITDVMICKLRKKLPGLINTNWGRGYFIDRADSDDFVPLQRTEDSMTPVQRLQKALAR